MNPETQGVDLTGLSVAVGRIEEKLSHLAGMEDRLRTVETKLTEMQAQQKPKAPWWVIVGGIAGVVTALIGFWTLFNLATDLAQLVP